MKLTKIIALTTIISSCGKEPTNVSKEVLVSITNQCRTTMKVYDTLENRQRLIDIYDCSYKSILLIYLDEGYYKIVAENFQGRRVRKNFKKGKYSQPVDTVS
jgi:hypothetical protein